MTARCECPACVRRRNPVALPGMVLITVEGDECQRCEHFWVRRPKGVAAKVCPHCKNPYRVAS